MTSCRIALLTACRIAPLACSTNLSLRIFAGSRVPLSPRPASDERAAPSAPAFAADGRMRMANREVNQCDKAAAKR